MTDAEFIKEVIREVNEIRVALKLEPLVDLPKGEVGKSGWCPIATALESQGAWSDEILLPEGLLLKLADEPDRYPNPNVVAYETPKLIGEFIRRFDEYEFPQYDLREGEYPHENGE